MCEGWETHSTGSDNLQIITVILKPENNILLLISYFKSCLAQAQLQKYWSQRETAGGSKNDRKAVR